MTSTQKPDESSIGAQQHESATLMTARIPAEEFALHETFMSIPELEAKCAHLIATGNEVLIPLLWIRSDESTELDSVLTADPSVNAATELIHTDDRQLYHMRWNYEVRLRCQIVLDSEAILLDGYGSEDHWTFELLFSSRDALRRTCKNCEKYDLTYTIDRIRGLQDTRSQTTHLGLTPEQHEALAEAYKRGYFKVPRQITLDELAEVLDISHQALSERLRRGHDALMKETLRDPSLGFGPNPTFRSDSTTDSETETDPATKRPVSDSLLQ